MHKRQYRRKVIWAIIIPILFFLVVEGALRFTQFAPLSKSEWSHKNGVFSVERYYSQAPGHFIEADDGHCETDPTMLRGNSSVSWAMQPQKFSCIPANKRIITLGGSSVQGYGLKSQYTIASQMQKELSTRGFDVINAGVAGYNTLQTRRMMPEIWALKPNILVIYAGHNDYVYYPVVEALLKDNPGYQSIRTFGDKFATWGLLRSLLRKVGWMPKIPTIPSPKREVNFNLKAAAAFNQSPLSKPSTQREVKQIIDEQKKAQENIKGFYRENITDIVVEAQSKGIEVLLIAPVSRLDSPPMDGVHWTELNDNELLEFQTLWLELQKAPPPFEDHRWLKALDLSKNYAPLAHAYAQAAWLDGKQNIAIEYWRIAQNYAPPSRSIRAGDPMGDWVIETGKKLKVPVIDPRVHFRQSAEIIDIPAGSLFLDALHFTSRGAKIISQLSIDVMEKELWIPAPNPVH
jgi:hypothetical protein